MQGEEKEITHCRHFLKDGASKVSKERRAKCVPVVLTEVEWPVLVGGGVGDVEGGLRRKQSAERAENKRRNAHPDKIDDEPVKEPKKEVAEQLTALLEVKRVRFLLLVLLVGGGGRGEPGAVEESESLQKSMDGRRLPAT